MIIKNLTQDQVKTIYNNHMVNDFPASELKPLSMILKGMEKKIFECLGQVDEESGEILAYAVFVKNGNDYLFDYLAVISDSRNSGIGSSFLKQIAEHYKQADSVIGEVEDPVFAKDDEEKNLQERRIGFYKRNGYIDTNVRVKLFGVDFKVFEMNLGRKHSEEEIKQLYKSHYKKILPIFLYWRSVKIKKQKIAVRNYEGTEQLQLQT